MKDIKTASDSHATFELLKALRKNDLKKKEKALVKAEKKIKRIFYFVFALLAGMAMGYTWCFFALSK